jgi:cephalosporin hydroxylase
MTLAEMYEARCAARSDIFEHLPTFLRLVEERNAQHVIELGTRSGVSTVAWLYALERTGGRLTSVDVSPAPDIGVWPHWRHLQGHDIEVADELLPQADIVFIDTSHHYAHTLAELRLYRSWVADGGLFVLHDTELEWPDGAPAADGPFPVKRAIEEFCAETGFAWTNDPRCYGLGIIEVAA